MTNKLKSKFDLKEALLYRMTTREQSVKSKFDLKEYNIYKMMKQRGRPVGSTKESDRRTVKNPTGRQIDYGGPQYTKLIQNGYMLNVDGTQLISNPNFKSDKVKNPETGRLINKFTYPLKLKNGKPMVNEDGKWIAEAKIANKFKELYNKYFYDD